MASAGIPAASISRTFGKAGGQEHFAEHIEAVVTGRPVGADGEVDAVIVKTLQRADAGGELQV